MLADDLIQTAGRLTEPRRGRPRQSDLRRSISTSYYSVFHALAANAADLLVGVGGARWSDEWSHVYRALDHGFAKNVCGQVRGLAELAEIRSCATTFVRLQEMRHQADYDPFARFSLIDAVFATQLAQEAVADLNRAPRGDRRKFAIRLLMRNRQT